MGAHVACYAEKLGWVDRMLSTYPNFAVDIGGRLGELGRQPRAFARLVHRHPDQVIFGTDCFPPTTDDYALHYRFLETEDEHFADWTGAGPVGPQGRWHISGASISPSLLRRLYATTARRFLGVG